MKMIPDKQFLENANLEILKLTLGYYNIQSLINILIVLIENEKNNQDRIKIVQEHIFEYCFKIVSGTTFDLNVENIKKISDWLKPQY